MAAIYQTPARPLTFLITGGSSGFGLSLARYAQAGGHHVIATSRNPSKTPELVKEIEGRGGKLLALDVNDRNSPKFVHDLEASGTHIDVLVNNAGYSVFAPIETATDEEIREQTETLYFGPLRLIKAVLPYQRERRFGIIANMSSGAALEGNPSMGPYAGAKAGLDALSKVLAKEVAAFNIRVLTIGLGTFNTNFGNAAKAGTAPVPDDYKGSMAEKMIDAMTTGKYDSLNLANGDKDIAMKAAYEVITGTGVGTGKEAQKFLPLGKDLYDRVNTVKASLDDALANFGDIAKSCALPGK